MWFFIAVLVLWVSTALIGRQDSYVLPPVVQWCWWTTVLFVCGVAATRSAFLNLSDRMGGLFGFALFLLYYMTQSGTYVAFLPADSANPDLWPTVFVAVNLVGPVVLVSAGCIATTVQRGRGR